jgi:glutathione S-transferase
MNIMTTQLRPITLWGGVMSPNPPKVAMVLNELEIPYKSNYIEFSELKKPAYSEINPNGRLPAIQDPNTGITLWESGAILEYLIAEYDHEHKLSFLGGTKEAYQTNQWLFFQVSGQGPYYGQASWFKFGHPEKVQSAQDRYINEIRRVSKVLDTHLDGKQFLVGDKCTYADLAFLPWQEGIPMLVGDTFDPVVEFPNVHAWLARMKARPGVAKVLKEKAEKTAAMMNQKEENMQENKEKET